MEMSTKLPGLHIETLDATGKTCCRGTVLWPPEGGQVGQSLPVLRNRASAYGS